MSVSQQETTADRAEPSTLVEALARFNMTVDHALDLARRCRDGYDGGDYEYDQGDVVVIDYDDLYNLARVALASMSLIRRGYDGHRIGLATNRQLLAELSTRIEIDYFDGGMGLDYAPVGGRPESSLDG